MTFNDSPLGLELITDNFYLLFGNKNLKVSTYKSTISERMEEELEFFYVNQVHGDGIHFINDSKAQPEEADAMICSKKNLALTIKTADCVPVFIFDKVTKQLAMIHAGWRGVLNDICLKSIRHMNPSSPEDLVIAIGPHIHSNNFQVQSDLVNLFQSKFPFIKDPTHFVPDLNQEGHYFMNLGKILRDRLFHELKTNIELLDCNTDTFAHQSFHSFRRDGDQAGRNLNIAYLR